MMQVSPATLLDVPELERLVNSAYRGESSRQGWTTEADMLDGIRIDGDRLREIIQQENAVILKAVEDGNLIGCVHLEKHANKLYLGMLTVSPTLQNKGTGKLLLAASEQEARNRGCISVYMTVLTERDTLIAWYVRHGYVNTRKKKPFPMGDPRFGLPKKELEFFVLEKNLS